MYVLVPIFPSLFQSQRDFVSKTSDSELLIVVVEIMKKVISEETAERTRGYMYDCDSVFTCAHLCIVGLGSELQ